jgi:hypothetical protein
VLLVNSPLLTAKSPVFSALKVPFRPQSALFLAHCAILVNMLRILAVCLARVVLLVNSPPKVAASSVSHAHLANFQTHRVLFLACHVMMVSFNRVLDRLPVLHARQDLLVSVLAKSNVLLALLELLVTQLKVRLASHVLQENTHQRRARLSARIAMQVILQAEKVLLFVIFVLVVSLLMVLRLHATHVLLGSSKTEHPTAFV